MALTERDLWLGTQVLEKRLAPREHLLRAAQRRHAGSTDALGAILVDDGILTLGQLERLGDGELPLDEPPAWALPFLRPGSARLRRASGKLLKERESDAVETLLAGPPASHPGRVESRRTKRVESRRTKRVESRRARAGPQAPPARPRPSKPGDEQDGIATLIGGIPAADLPASPPPGRDERARRSGQEEGVQTLLDGVVLDPQNLPPPSKPENQATETLPLKEPPRATARLEKPPSDAILMRRFEPASSGHNPAVVKAVTSLAGAVLKGESPKPSSSMPASLGGYEVLDELGRGAMGVVYRCRAPNLNRLCAIKVIRSTDTAGIRQILRFQNEAVLAARLRHPNIVGVFDAGEDEGRFYLVMELVEGGTFAEWIKAHKEPSDLEAGIRVVIGAADALAYAHSRGVIHRDMKPENVIVTTEGEARITDFGIARGGDEELGLTREGRTVGTLHYVPPEQVNGELDRIGPRSDVYALGATLYHLLTGAAPFSDDEDLSPFYQVLKVDPRRPSELARERGRPSVSQALDLICLKAMEKDAERRYASAAELANDLRAFLEQRAISVQPESGGQRFARWTRRHQGRLANAALLLTLVVAVSAGFAGAASWQGSLSAKVLEGQDEQAGMEHAATIARAIRVDMLTGRADLARTLSRQLNAGEGPKIAVARADGSLAYRDPRTRDAVAERIASPQHRLDAEKRFPELVASLEELEARGFAAIDRSEDAEDAGKLEGIDPAAWQRLLRTREPVSARSPGDENSEPELVVLYPLLNEERCQVCHGGVGNSPYAGENNRVRGVVVVRRSQSGLQSSVRAVQRTILFVGAGTALLTGLIVLLLTRALGLRPRKRTYGLAPDHDSLDASTEERLL